MNKLLADWDDKQHELAAKVSFIDSFDPIRYIGGLDVTFVEEDEPDAAFGIGALVVVDRENLALVYSDCYETKCSIPYVSGYLGFRELEFSRILIQRLQQNRPELVPQIFLVDGCGYYHPRKCGYASQLGVELDVPTVGVSKSFLQVDGLDMKEYEVSMPYKSVKYLKGKSGTIWGAALYSSSGGGHHPLYVSVGHRVSLDSCISVVSHSLKHKIPEPIRLADLLSREKVREYRAKKTQI